MWPPKLKRLVLLRVLFDVACRALLAMLVVLANATGWHDRYVLNVDGLGRLILASRLPVQPPKLGLIPSIVPTSFAQLCLWVYHLHQLLSFALSIQASKQPCNQTQMQATSPASSPLVPNQVAEFHVAYMYCSPGADLSKSAHKLSSYSQSPGAKQPPAVSSATACTPCITTTAAAATTGAAADSPGQCARSAATGSTPAAQEGGRKQPS